jgi:hypothetical protein
VALPEHREHPGRVIPLDARGHLPARAGIPEELRAPLDHARLVELVDAVVPREPAVVVQGGVQGGVRVGDIVGEEAGEAKRLAPVPGPHRRDQRLVEALHRPGHQARAPEPLRAVARSRGGRIGRDIGEGRLREALEVEIVPHLLARAVEALELGVRLDRALDQLLAPLPEERPQRARRPLDGVPRDDPVSGEPPCERRIGRG